MKSELKCFFGIRVNSISKIGHYIKREGVWEGILHTHTHTHTQQKQSLMQLLALFVDSKQRCGSFKRFPDSALGATAEQYL